MQQNSAKGMQEYPRLGEKGDPVEIVQEIEIKM